MKKLLIVGVAVLALTGCSTLEESTATGAAAGAVIGGVATGNLAGAAVGAAIGGAAGYMVYRVAGSPTDCYYKDAKGHITRDVCPKG